MKITHVRDKTFTVYIGRPSVFGNPFIIGVHGTRKQCIRKFRKYAWKNERILTAIRALKKDAILGCHCKPKLCHGDEIIAIRKQLIRTEKEHAKLIEESDVSRVPSKSKSRADLHGLSRKGRSHNGARRRQ